MTTTIEAATMTVTLQESISLNGYEQGAKNTHTIASIAEVSKRIVTVTTTEATVATFSAAIAALNVATTASVVVTVTILFDTSAMLAIVVIFLEPWSYPFKFIDSVSVTDKVAAVSVLVMFIYILS